MKQTHTYLSSFDVALTSLDKLNTSQEEELKFFPETSFEDVYQTGDLDFMIACLPRP